ncbi:Mov34/MPN/PAD-1 family protein [Pseudomonas aeruginosa]|uniref:Mov34/MPN/PAD-1 family protein n=1 Tax=Pseudomonas aeruginosa TaxID=287 RepID=UPI003907FADD
MRHRSLIEPSSKRLVVVSEEVMTLIKSYRQSSPEDWEAGGILMGKRRGQHFEVTFATAPQVKDIRSRYGFIRHPDGHQDIAENRLKVTNGEENYIGEWHTHPEIHPSPSTIDMRDWRRLSKTHRTPLLVIIGGIQACYFGILINSRLHMLKECMASS